MLENTILKNKKIIFILSIVALALIVIGSFQFFLTIVYDSYYKNDSWDLVPRFFYQVNFPDFKGFITFLVLISGPIIYFVYLLKFNVNKRNLKTFMIIIFSLIILYEVILISNFSKLYAEPKYLLFLFYSFLIILAFSFLLYELFIDFKDKKNILVSCLITLLVEFLRLLTNLTNFSDYIYLNLYLSIILSTTLGIGLIIFMFALGLYILDPYFKNNLNSLTLNDNELKLKTLKESYDLGVITQDMYNHKKQEILNEIIKRRV